MNRLAHFIVESIDHFPFSSFFSEKTTIFDFFFCSLQRDLDYILRVNYLLNNLVSSFLVISCGFLNAGNIGYHQYAVLCATRVPNNNLRNNFYENTFWCVQGMPPW